MVVFLVAGGLGLLVLLTSLIFGEVFDGTLELIDSEWFSGTAVGAFLVTFGCVGLLLMQVMPMSGAVSGGATAGFAVGYAALRLSAWLSQDDGNRLSSNHFLNASGRVTVPIPADGLGMVQVVVNGHLTRLNARAHQPVGPGTLVTVVEILFPNAVMVSPASKNAV